MKLKVIRQVSTGHFLSAIAFEAWQEGREIPVNLWVNNIDRAAWISADEVPMACDGCEQIDLAKIMFPEAGR